MCLDCTGEPVVDVNVNNLRKAVQVVAVKDKKTPVRSLAEKMVATDGFEAKILIFVDDGLSIDDINLVVWYAAGNVDPSTDCFVMDNGRGGCLCMDATAKTSADDDFTRDWPEVVMMDDETIESVDNKKIGDLTPSPSIKLRKLRYNNGAVKFFNSSD